MLVYDDGTCENGIAMATENAGITVRMTPDRLSRILGTSIYFYDAIWPIPGGDEVGIAIFDSDENGEPGGIIGEPKYVRIKRGEWNYIDLQEYNFMTDKDFYIGTYQKYIDLLSPAVGFDLSGPKEQRSYLHVGGKFQRATENLGNAMIRGNVEYALNIPQISNLSEINYTNEDSIDRRPTNGKLTKQYSNNWR